MKNRYWSSKHVTYVQGSSTWVRADYADRMRDRLLVNGRVETGHTLVTGGKQYIEFLLEDAA